MYALTAFFSVPVFPEIILKYDFFRRVEVPEAIYYDTFRL